MENTKDMEVSHRYTRAEAISDGILIDVTELAREVGFRFPMAITYPVWERCVAKSLECEYEQDESQRLRDLLSILMYTIQMQGCQNPTSFHALAQTSANSYAEVKLKAICSGGDDGKPVLTVMLPDDD